MKKENNKQDKVSGVRIFMALVIAYLFGCLSTFVGLVILGFYFGSI